MGREPRGSWAHGGGASEEDVPPPDTAGPGDLLLHPITLAALGLLLLNDHVLKGAWPGVVTGKLSDVAGLAFFPTLVVAGWELALAPARRWHGPRARRSVVAVGLTGAAFALAKTLPLAAHAAAWAGGWAQWLIALPVRIALGSPHPPVVPVVVVADPTDLVALAALVAPLWLTRRRGSRSGNRMVRQADATRPARRTA